MVLKVLTKADRSTLKSLYDTLRSNLDARLGQGVRYRGLYIIGRNNEVLGILALYEVPVQDPDGDTVYVSGRQDIWGLMDATAKQKTQSIYEKVLNALRNRYGLDSYIEGVEVVRGQDDTVHLRVVVNYKVDAPGVGSTRARKVVEVS